MAEHLTTCFSAPSVKTSAEHIVATAGSMSGFYSTFLALFAPGDECLIPFPGFSNHAQVSQACECELDHDQPKATELSAKQADGEGANDRVPRILNI